MQSNLKQFLALFAPSWLSGVVVAVVAFVATALAAVNAGGGKGALKEGVDSASSITVPFFKHLVDTFAQSTIVSNLPLLLLYAAVGVVIYLVALHIIEGLRDTVELSQTMNYVHANRDSIFLSTIARLVVRVLVTFTWAAYGIVFIKVILPVFSELTGSIAMAGAATASLHVLEAFFILLVALHIHIVMLRLFLLRRISRR